MKHLFFLLAVIISLSTNAQEKKDIFNLHVDYSFKNKNNEEQILKVSYAENGDKLFFDLSDDSILSKLAGNPKNDSFNNVESIQFLLDKNADEIWANFKMLDFLDLYLSLDMNIVSQKLKEKNDLPFQPDESLSLIPKNMNKKSVILGEECNWHMLLEDENDKLDNALYVCLKTDYKFDLNPHIKKILHIMMGLSQNASDNLEINIPNGVILQAGREIDNPFFKASKVSKEVREFSNNIEFGFKK